MDDTRQNDQSEKERRRRHVVLLVDDQEMIGEVVCRMLHKEDDIGFHFCADATDAMGTALKVDPTVILQDLIMPEIDGLTLVRGFRAEPRTRHIPLIVLSSEEHPETKAEAFAAGANDYIIKLPDRLELIARIRYHSRGYINMLEKNEAFEAVLQSRAALQESETRYRELFRHMSSGVLVLTPFGNGRDFILTDINRAAEKMEKISRDDVLGKRLGAILPRIPDSPLLAALRSVAHTGKSIQLLNSYEQDMVWYMDYIYRLESGEVIVVYDDISEQRRAEIKLRDAYNTMTAVLSQVPIGIIIADLNGNISWVNQAGMSILREPSPDTIVGKNITDYREDGIAADDLLSSGDIHNAECALNIAGKQRITVMESILRTTMNGENVLLGAFIDISEQKRAEEENKIIQIKLQQSQKLESIGKLAAGIAHEINTPLQFIRDNLEFLRRALPGINRILQMLESLVNNGKTISDRQIDSLKEQMEKEDIGFVLGESINAISQCSEGAGHVAGIVAAMKDFAGSSGEMSRCNINRMIEVAVTVSSNQWKAVAEMKLQLHPEPLEIRCCREEINQVILNLIVNAAQAIGEANPENKEKGVITVTSFPEENCVVIHVADSGSGIPAHLKDRIYEPFFTTRPLGKGLGQGLTAAYDIVVNKHCGELDFTSEPGRGTVFRVRIPVSPPPTREPDKDNPYNTQ